jgi:hypothetical protein
MAPAALGIARVDSQMLSVSERTVLGVSLVSERPLLTRTVVNPAPEREGGKIGITATPLSFVDEY